MGKSRAEIRSDRILSRQSVDLWGRQYVPAIKAVREEGPSCSYLTRVYSAKLGRVMHSLSRGEELLFRLALQHPDVFEVHEQKMLSRFSRPHPLSDELRSHGIIAKGMEGTIPVAERLGLLKLHPKVYVDGDDGQLIARAYPLVGDILLFIRRPDETPYCVNWSIKNSQIEFLEKNPRRLKSIKKRARDTERSQFRQNVEIAYYADAGIATFHISPDLIDMNVLLNLKLCQGFESRLVNVSLTKRTRFYADILSTFRTKYSPMDVIRDHAGLNEEHILRSLFYQGVWSRHLRLDLFRPILIDYPVQREVADVFDVYGKYFNREVVS